MDRKNIAGNVVKATSDSAFYILDLVEKLVKEKNVASIVYLAINVAVVCEIFESLFPGGNSVCIGVIVYIISAVLSMSPFGEWVLRKTHGCQSLKEYAPGAYERCMPLFEEVKSKAKQIHTDFVIDEKIELYIKEDPDVNAFAVGRRTICLSTGLLNCSDDEIKAVLGHEFGHLVAHDTDLKLLILVGNFIVTAYVTVVRVVLSVIQFGMAIIGVFFGRDGALAAASTAAFNTLYVFFVDILMWIWTKIGMLLTMKTSREAEYVADLFSCQMGYYEGLRSVFEGFLSKEYTVASGGLRGKLDVFATLASSHPATEKRIARIDEYMNSQVEKC